VDIIKVQCAIKGSASPALAAGPRSASVAQRDSGEGKPAPDSNFTSFVFVGPAARAGLFRAVHIKKPKQKFL
jgi:hypothetical protein